MTKKILLVALVVLFPFTSLAQDKPATKTVATKQLSEVSKLKAENFKLKIQLMQMQIAQEQAKLEDGFARELGCVSFDWASLACKE